jgi:hypothetical protein
LLGRALSLDSRSAVQAGARAALITLAFAALIVLWAGSIEFEID